jgi:3-phosphoshikimate 1-carboxyvinyltransferase
MESLRLDPVEKIEGEIHLPGSKSLSNRALLLAALAEGRTTIDNLLDSDDIRHMLEALSRLGLSTELSANHRSCTIAGNGGPFRNSQPLELFLGNAGTAFRPLCAALCLGSGEYTLTGEPRMEERPIGDLVDSLCQAGASISYLKNAGYPPLKIEAAGLRGGELTVSGSISSQYLSALLMAAPLFAQDTVITVVGEFVSKPYIDLTLGIVEKFGCKIGTDRGRRFEIAAGQTYHSPGRLLIEGDASSASYFFAAAAIKGGSVQVHGLPDDSRQGDLAFLDALAEMGAKVTRNPEVIEVCPGSALRGIDIDANRFPDAAMTLATTALFAEGRTTIRNIANWRVKETDRLAAMAIELRKVGATVEEGSDYITIDPPAATRHAAIDTYNDHRMAMCFSLLALAPASVTINDPGCVSKTFPKYFAEFASISR